jgi:ABC-type bacteriocin/lantibiotic exporter with double-glycine peptidase domain
MRAAAVVVLAVFLQTGCAAPRAAGASDARKVRLEVPFFPDDTDQCGPSSLASVLQFWGNASAPAELKKEIYREKLRGALTVDMLLAAQSRGFSAEMENGTLALVKAELEAGRPVIAFLNLGFRAYPIGHYLVVTGYDEGRGSLIVHSGKKRDHLVSFAKFDKLWEKTNRWTLLIRPRS